MFKDEKAQRIKILKDLKTQKSLIKEVDITSDYSQDFEKEEVVSKRGTAMSKKSTTFRKLSYEETSS